MAGALRREGDKRDVAAIFRKWSDGPEPSMPKNERRSDRLSRLVLIGSLQIARTQLCDLNLVEPYLLLQVGFDSAPVTIDFRECYGEVRPAVRHLERVRRRGRIPPDATRRVATPPRRGPPRSARGMMIAAGRTTAGEHRPRGT